MENEPNIWKTNPNVPNHQPNKKMSRYHEPYRTIPNLDGSDWSRKMGSEHSDHSPFHPPVYHLPHYLWLFGALKPPFSAKAISSIHYSLVTSL
jgi:hypothetical protein